MHFVDVGDRAHPPVVLVHGNPTWGYLYRHLIPPLVAAGFRVIVPDHLGFGRSDKPTSPALHAVQRHARRFESLLDSLDLRHATLVLHDWGGPIGLPWGTRHRDRLRGLVILNSFAHRPRAPVPLPLALRLFRTRGLGELFVKRLHAIVRVFLFRAGVTRPERLTRMDRTAYLAPHPDAASRTAILALARQFPAGPDGAVAEFLGRVHEGLAGLAALPVLIAWADRDVVFTQPALDRWREDFPHAELLRLPDSGHFVQEDAYELLLPALLAFLSRPST